MKTMLTQILILILHSNIAIYLFLIHHDVFINPEMEGVVEFTNLKHSFAKIYVKLKMSFNEIVTVVEYLITCFL